MEHYCRRCSIVTYSTEATVYLHFFIFLDSYEQCVQLLQGKLRSRAREIASRAEGYC
jgi:hypothetical protein